MKTGWHSWLLEPNGESTFGFHMNENQLWEPVLFTFYFLFLRIG
jgi:hypothetical protein